MILTPISKQKTPRQISLLAFGDEWTNGLLARVFMDVSQPEFLISRRKTSQFPRVQKALSRAAQKTFTGLPTNE